ncbi:MAG: hypothetical protein QE278_05195 [Limnobacter sp.]|nr:hypothetical protein [Limnobacter sp.]
MNPQCLIQRVQASFFALPLLLFPSFVNAHAFGRTYSLPVPVWLYMYGTVAALLLSVIVCALVVTAQEPETAPRTLTVKIVHRVTRFLMWGSVGLLAFAMVTGWFGIRNAYFNFNMTFFWIICFLGLFYLSAMFGNFFRLINPWENWVRLLQLRNASVFEGQRSYPVGLGLYPALALYVVLIWIELFGGTNPWSLSWVLLAYTGLNLLAAWWWGREAWFSQGEVFNVLFGFAARISPWSFKRVNESQSSPVQIQKMAWCSGLLHQPVTHLSVLMFVLFMLSSTAFDGLKETVIWKEVFWGNIYPWLVPQLGDNAIVLYPLFKKLEIAFDSVVMGLSMFVYLSLYWICIASIRWITGSELSTQQLALRFTLSLVPIAFVYNLAHYYTLLFTQGVHLPRLMIDPFGWGWNPFGVKAFLPAPIFLDGGWIWHSQVGVIVAGHILSVYLAHMEATQIFKTRKLALLSQIPMLILMVFLTSMGLWIMAQPMSAGGRF